MNELGEVVSQQGVPTPADFAIPLDISQIVPVESYVAEWARKKPDRPALIVQGQMVTYQELNNQAAAVAQALLDILGEGNHPVGILDGRDQFAVIATLGVLKSGKFYAGMDPSSPQAYLRLICDDLNPPVILTSRIHQKIAQQIAGEHTRVIEIEELLKNAPSSFPDRSVSLEDLAGVYYTSGTTGKPKGVLVDQKSLWYRTLMSLQSFKFSPSDRTCLPFPVSFGWSTTPLFGTLAAGGTVLTYDFTGNPPDEVAEWLVKNRITFCPIPAPFFKLLMSSLQEANHKFPDMRLIFVASSAVRTQDLLLWQESFSPSCVLAYGFSSTEAGPITRSYYTIESPITDDSLHFNMPADGVGIMVVDRGGNLLPAGEKGEMAIDSNGIMQGYWNRPALNRVKFLDHPSKPGEVILLTGDLGRLDENGHLEFLGRADKKVKIRGYLVDMGAIETTIRNLPYVDDTVVTTFERKSGELHLAAYLVLDWHSQMTVPDIRRELADELPDQMVPRVIKIMDSFPCNARGKVILSQLPEPTIERPALESVYIAPRTEMEQAIAEIWQDMLEIDTVGARDNFFELGGDSLSALEMTLLVEKSLSKMVPQTFFETPTVANLADLLRESGPRSGPQQEEPLADRRFASRIDGPRSPDLLKSILAKLAALSDMERVGRRLDWYLDLLVARYLSHLPYLEATQWIVNFSQKAWVQNFLFRRRKRQFARWWGDIGGSAQDEASSFQKSLVTNLHSRLNYYRGLNIKSSRFRDDIKTHVEKWKRSSSIYWSSLAELILETPPADFEDYFPIQGMEYLVDALEGGHGVILLSFHGIMAPIRIIPLKWQLGRDIVTISYLIPREIRQIDKNQLSAAEGMALNAEIALHGERVLQDGGVINIISDSGDPYGMDYQIVLGKRNYHIMSGFAEIAERTGAKVIPYFGRTLSDGRPETILYPPLASESTDRWQIIEDLIRQYSDFVNHVWLNNPESVRWKVMVNHFFHQRAG